MDRYRTMADRLDFDATALDERASGYRMTGEDYLARVALTAALKVRDAADALRDMRAIEDRAREMTNAAL